MHSGRYSPLHQAHDRIKTERKEAAAAEMSEIRRERQERQRDRPVTGAQAGGAARVESRQRSAARPPLTGEEDPEGGVPKQHRRPPTATPWGAHPAPAPEGTMRIYRAGAVRGARIHTDKPTATATPDRFLPAQNEPLHHAQWRRVTTIRIETEQAREAARSAQKAEDQPLGFIPPAKQEKTKPARIEQPPAYRRYSTEVNIGPGEEC